MRLFSKESFEMRKAKKRKEKSRPEKNASSKRYTQMYNKRHLSIFDSVLKMQETKPLFYGNEWDSGTKNDIHLFTITESQRNFALHTQI